MYPAIALSLSFSMQGILGRCGEKNAFLHFILFFTKPVGLDFISLTPPSPPSGQNRGDIIHFARFYSVGVRNR